MNIIGLRARKARRRLQTHRDVRLQQSLGRAKGEGDGAPTLHRRRSLRRPRAATQLSRARFGSLVKFLEIFI